MVELCSVLTPFAEATPLTQGDQGVTIGIVVPTVLDKYNRMYKSKENTRHCKALVTELSSFLLTRFKGVFTSCNMVPGTAGAHDEPFCDNIYLVAAVLDPRYGMQWVDAEVKYVNQLDRDAASLHQLREDTKEMLQRIGHNSC